MTAPPVVEEVQDLRIPYGEGEDFWGTLPSAEAPFRVAVELGDERHNWFFDLAAEVLGLSTNQS